jgi:hypothetical protein
MDLTTEYVSDFRPLPFQLAAQPGLAADALRAGNDAALAFPSAQVQLLKGTRLGRALGAAEAYRWAACYMSRICSF